MNTIERELGALADSPDDFAYRDGTVIMQRHGSEMVLEIRSLPGLGVCVRGSAAEEQAEFVPMAIFVQRSLLKLHVLASQVARAVERAMKLRPIPYIETPGSVTIGVLTETVPEARNALAEFLKCPTPEVTGVIELMASAGQGKTILLESIALALAQEFVPNEHPTPLLLNVDLLGRYVGSVEDAIAGSLNNTYVFPSLTQRDVIYCIKRGWIALALDGFDELVARVGTRDAFIRLNDLIEQLEGSGTIIVSARESFFELYQISSAIRQFVQPRRGSYSVRALRLLPWTEVQGRIVFQSLGSESPDAELAALLRAFDGAKDIALHPFFLPRLADLWQKGERFEAIAAVGGPLARMRYVIDTFIHRETTEKWVQRDSRMPTLDIEQHSILLGVIAEEMWLSSAFRLDSEELRLAAAMALDEIGASKSVAESVTARISTHAALSARGAMHGFLHDRFFYYYLGLRLGRLIAKGDRQALLVMFSIGDLQPDVLEWAAYCLATNTEQLGSYFRILNALFTQDSDLAVVQNASSCAVRLAVQAGALSVANVVLDSMMIAGDVLRGRTLSKVTFLKCVFGQCDLKGTRLEQCTFDTCQLGDLLIDSETSFSESRFSKCIARSACDADAERTYFDPTEIRRTIAGYGGHFEVPAVQPTVALPFPNMKLVACVERVVRLSDRQTDVAIEDLYERFGEDAALVAKVGVATGVFKTVQRPTSGPKKHFVRFAVDRSLVLPGQSGPTNVKAIDEFWNQLRAHRPRA